MRDWDALWVLIRQLYTFGLHISSKIDPYDMVLPFLFFYSLFFPFYSFSFFLSFLFLIYYTQKQYIRSPHIPKDEEINPHLHPVILSENYKPFDIQKLYHLMVMFHFFNF